MSCLFCNCTTDSKITFINEPCCIGCRKLLSLGYSFLPCLCGRQTSFISDGKMEMYTPIEMECCLILNSEGEA